VARSEERATKPLALLCDQTLRNIVSCSTNMKIKTPNTILCPIKLSSFRTLSNNFFPLHLL
jgi:hypothetical protein